MSDTVQDLSSKRVIELPADVEVAFSIRVSDVWCWLEMPSDTSGAASDATDIGSAIVGTKTSSTAALHQRWRIKHTPSPGIYKFQNVASGKYWAFAGQSATEFKLYDVDADIVYIGPVSIPDNNSVAAVKVRGEPGPTYPTCLVSILAPNPRYWNYEFV